MRQAQVLPSRARVGHLPARWTRLLLPLPFQTHHPGRPPPLSFSPTSLSYLILCGPWHWLTASPPNSCHHWKPQPLGGPSTWPRWLTQPTLSVFGSLCSQPPVSAGECAKVMVGPVPAGAYALLGLPAPGLPPAQDLFPPAVIWLPWVCNSVPQCGVASAHFLGIKAVVLGLHFPDEAVEAREALAWSPVMSQRQIVTAPGSGGAEDLGQSLHPC